MQNHNNATIMMSGHSSLEKYTSHFIERVWKGYEGYYCVRDELETKENCNILTPTLMAITVFLSHSPGLLNQGPEAQPLLGHGSHSSIFSPTNLNFLSLRLYNNLTPTYFLRASQFCTQFNPDCPWSPDIFKQMHLLFTQVHLSFDSLAGINMQQ